MPAKYVKVADRPKVLVANLPSDLGPQDMAQLLADIERAQPAEEPSAPTEVIQRGDGVNEPSIMKAKGTSAGYSYLWDNRTGERSRTNNNMLPTQLKKRYQDGDKGKRFSVVDPHIVSKIERYKCLLASDNPNRALYDTMGFSTHNKDNFPNAWSLRRHMEVKHKTEWAAMEQMRIDAEKKEEREFQRGLIAMATKAGAA